MQTEERRAASATPGGWVPRPRAETLITAATVGALLLFWQLVASSGLVPSYFVPTPLQTWQTFLDILATGTTVILITHSVEEALYLGTRTLVMSPRPGRIVADIATPFSREDGVGRAVRSRPDFIAAREQILAHIWQELG